MPLTEHRLEVADPECEIEERPESQDADPNKEIGMPEADQKCRRSGRPYAAGRSDPDTACRKHIRERPSENDDRDLSGCGRKRVPNGGNRTVFFAYELHDSIAGPRSVPHHTKKHEVDCDDSQPSQPCPNDVPKLVHDDCDENARLRACPRQPDNCGGRPATNDSPFRSQLLRTAKTKTAAVGPRKTIHLRTRCSITR